MKYGRIDGIDKDVSRIGQGLMMLGGGDINEDFALLDAVFEEGVTLFDSAHIYGGGWPDRVFGQWLKARGNRDKVVLLDKCCHPRAGKPMVRPDVITAELNDCFQRLGADYIDIFCMHRDDPTQPIGPLVERMNELIDAGKIGAYGGSNWTFERVAEANAYAAAHGLKPMAVVSNQYSLAECIDDPWGGGCVTNTGQAAVDARAYYAEQSTALVNWSSLAGGFCTGRFTRENVASFDDPNDQRCIRCFASEANFTRIDRAAELADRHNASVAQIAVAWQLHGELACYPLTAAYSPEQARDNAAAAEIELTDEEMTYLTDVE